MKKELQQAIKNFDVISFNIFDTAILRPYIKPSDVFLHVERIMGLKNYAKNRINAEQKARSLTKEDEIQYKDIYKLMAKSYQIAYEFETNFEKQICQRNEEIYAVYQMALKENKRIIFTSDIYLPETVIKEILSKNGYESYDHLFLSSTYLKTKSSGGLYDIAIKVTEANPEKILHIGDNKKSDVEKAKSKGLSPFYYKKVMDRFLNAHSNIYALLGDKTDSRFRKDELTLSVIIGLNSIIWNENCFQNYWTKIGSLYAAPFMYLFTRWVYDNAKKAGIKNIAFAARDGYNLIKIFNLFDEKKEFNPRYIYLPRHVSETCNIKSGEDLELFFKELGNNYSALLGFIGDFSKQNQEINLKWEEFGKKNKSLTYNDLKDFIISNQNDFIESSSNRRKIVFEYLSQLDLFKTNIIFVDSATIHARAQKLLHKLIKDNKLNISLTGYYYIIYRWHNILNQKELRPSNNDNRYRTDEWHLMEYFMSSPEKPIISIKKEGNEFLPVYQDIENNIHEKFRIKTYEDVSNGILLFANKAITTFGNLNIVSDIDSVVLHVNNLVSNPTNEDISHSRLLLHSEFNDNNYTPLIFKYNKIAQNIKKIYGQRVQVKKISPDFEHFFYGGINSMPTDSEEKNHLALNVPFMNRMPVNTDKANLCIINSYEDIEIIEDVTRWSFKFGTFLRYRPSHEGDIMYNKYDDETETFVSVIYNKYSKKHRIFPLPIIDVTSDGTKAICIDDQEYSRWMDPDIFAQNKRNNGIHLNNQKVEKDRGIYLLNLESGVYNCILHINDLIKESDYLNSERSSSIFIERISLNSVDERFLVSLKVFPNKGSVYSVSFSCDINGGSIFEIPGFSNVSEWIDKDRILLMSGEDNYEPNSKDKGFKILELEDLTGEAHEIDKTFFNELGRYVFSPDRQYILKESSCWFSAQYRKLQFYDRKRSRSICLGFFYSEPKFYNNNPDLRCDLNPRWSPCGNYISFDSIHEGYRGIYNIKTEEVLFEMERDLETISEKEISTLITNANAKVTEYVPFMKNISRKIKNKIKRILRRLDRLPFYRI